jgi:oligopeptide transport system permease protein
MLETDVQPGLQGIAEMERRRALGYERPIMVQYGIFLRNIMTKWDWGTSWGGGSYFTPVNEMLAARVPFTVIVNIYSMMFSIPIGIALGIWAALKKNKLTDHVISTFVMVFISVPMFIMAFLVQYTLGFRLQLFPIQVASLHEAGGYFTWHMINSLALPIISMSFWAVASLTRFTRAELTEALTSEYMLLARSKGLTKSRAITTHAMKNAMVPILPSILALFFSIFSGSMVIEMMFSIRGMGRMFIQSIQDRDYNVFVAATAFYAFISLSAMIITDLSYGFLDPRIKMGDR